MLRKINRLNEEIARWAFEIIFKRNYEWYVAFTNPTAGPWKTIKARSLQDGVTGEVYRFILEEDRPDIIMYNDELRSVIIFEAKDSLAKLKDKSQYLKSTEVVSKLANLLTNKGSNQFWRGRENYNIITGLLWGSVDSFSAQTERDSLFDLYQENIKRSDLVNPNLIIGIETLYSNSKLECFGYYKVYNSSPATHEFGKTIIESFFK